MTNYDFDSLLRDHPGLSDRLHTVTGSDILEQREVHSAIVAQTGIISLDMALGGIPPGLVEIFGASSVGKTALLCQILGFAQKNGTAVAFVAGEPFDEPYARTLGLNTDELPLLLGGDADLEDKLLDFLATFPKAMVGIDSLSAVHLEQREDFAAWNEFIFGFLQNLNAQCGPESCVLFTSQVRNARSARPGKVFASGVSSASKRQADLCSMRLQLMRTNVSDLTYTMEVNTIANTLALPAHLLELPATKGRGIDIHLDCVQIGLKTGVLTSRGPRIYLGELYLGSGARAAANAICYDPELHLKLISTLLSDA